MANPLSSSAGAPDLRARGPKRASACRLPLERALLALALAVPGLLPEAQARVAQRHPRSPAAAYGFAEIHPAWLQGGFWRGRPWPTGWYHTTPAGWAREGMAGGALITAAVNEALALQSAVIAVPASTQLLNFASVEVLPNSRIVFFFGSGVSRRRGVGECQLGLLNGRPVSGEDALVLNAACFVAFGRGV